jgi:hypothetical protein
MQTVDVLLPPTLVCIAQPIFFFTHFIEH